MEVNESNTALETLQKSEDIAHCCLFNALCFAELLYFTWLEVIIRELILIQMDCEERINYIKRMIR